VNILNLKEIFQHPNFYDFYFSLIDFIQKRRDIFPNTLQMLLKDESTIFLISLNMSQNI
jgi:hypothetical protein